MLYLQAARDYLPAAKANCVRVVINGENWGVYVNVQQVDKPFLAEWFKTKNGTRWKVPGSPNGRGGLEYLGADVDAYKQIYEIKGNDDPKAWAALVELTRVLNQTPPESLEQALAPILDVDNVLRFLALESALVNNDGYWVRASDYNIYLDPKGRFHLIPHDTNETFPARGRRRRTRVRARRRRDARSARRSQRHGQAASLEAPRGAGAPHALPGLRAGDRGASGSTGMCCSRSSRAVAVAHRGRGEGRHEAARRLRGVRGAASRTQGASPTRAGSSC